MASIPDDLPALREAITAVDRELLTLAAHRQRLARAVGAIKDREGRPIRDFAQEREVLDRAEATAAELGLPPQLARELAEALIRHSVTAQEQQRVRASLEGVGRRALVIGGAGRMGGWFVRFLASQGFTVTVADPVAPAGGDVAHVTDWRTLPLTDDLILVAAPLGATAAVLQALAERRPPGIVCDVGSLKTPLRGALDALVAAGVRTTSLHPMFGPDTELLSGRHVVLVDCGVPEANEAVRALFQPTMATVVPMELERHDRAIAYILGLSHAVNIAFASTLADSGETVHELDTLSSTTFAAQLAVASRVVAENPHLYFEIQAHNAYGLESLSALSLAVERLRAIVRAGDEAAFVHVMSRSHRWTAAHGTR